MARLLRSRGVDVVAYDLNPPGDDAGDCIFDVAAIPDVRLGDHTVLGAHSDRALLLAWPYEGSDDDGWDADALRLYKGDTVIYVGKLPMPTRTAERFYFKVLVYLDFLQLGGSRHRTCPHVL